MSKIIRCVKTPKGGYRVAEKPIGDSQVIKITYYDEDGFERGEMAVWKRYPIWRRVLDKIVGWLCWLFGR